MKLNLAEHFHSIKGEGLHTGVPMHFIRFAGCSVGRRVMNEVDGLYPSPKVGPNDERAWLCQTWDGRKFWCDTDFMPKLESTVEEMVSDTWEDHICITGGEPLNHPKEIQEIRDLYDGKIHIETSGTIDWVPPTDTWLTVSPKIGCLDSMVNRADEIKLVVDMDFDTKKIPLSVLKHRNVLLLPLHILKPNTTHTDINVMRCISLFRQFPHWRLTPQVHKLIGVK